jgi:PIN domain nuclease of toxin-antitoxin system
MSAISLRELADDPFPGANPPGGPIRPVVVAQAIQHGLTIATVDPDIAAYSVALLPTA